LTNPGLSPKNQKTKKKNFLDLIESLKNLDMPCPVLPKNKIKGNNCTVHMSMNTKISQGVKGYKGEKRMFIPQCPIACSVFYSPIQEEHNEISNLKDILIMLIIDSHFISSCRK
jgi:hypothetical protein